MRMTTAPTCHRPKPFVQKMLLVLLPLLVLPGCATENEAGTVVGSAAVGAAIGALGGAALGSTYHHGYYYGYPSRSDMAASGALAGAAVGGAIGMANVAQQRENQRREDYYRAQEAARPPGSTATPNAPLSGRWMIMAMSGPRKPAPRMSNGLAIKVTEYPGK